MKSDPAQNNPAGRATRRPKRKPSAILGELFAGKADQTFLIDTIHDRAFTYGAARALAADYRRVLAGLGVAPNQRVAFLLPNSPELVCCYLACLFAGITAVPVNPTLGPPEIETILRLSRPAALVFAEGDADAAARTAAAAPDCRLHALPAPGTVDPDRLPATAPGAPLDADPARIDDNALFSIHFTSGTTGTPKGVAHTVRSLLENAAAFNQAMGLTEADRYLHALPMSYMAGFLNTLLCPMMAGASIVLTRAFEASSVLTFWSPVIEHGVTTMWITPTILASLTRADRNPAAPEYARAHLRHCFVGTAPLPRANAGAFAEKYGIQPIESYGLSELLLVSANAGDAGAKPRSVGAPLDDVTIEVAAARDGSGGDGELSIHTPYAMAGYFTASPEGDALTPPSDPFPTGDSGHQDADGHIFITGRLKDIIICGGYNVSPRAVEEILNDHPGVLESAVVGLAHELQGEEVVAVVVLEHPDQAATVGGELRTRCRASLSRLSVPSRFLRMAALPKSSNGKIQKNQLRDLVASGRDTEPL